MSKSWICAKCKSTAYSKCPSQRSIFPEMEQAAWSNVLFTDVIHGPKGRREVIINLSDYRPTNDGVSDVKVITNTIVNMYKSRKAIASAICNHHWILNSKTETECSLGCTHDNLSSVLRKTKPKELLNIPQMINSFYTPISVLLEQCRVMVNISKDTFDNYSEDQNYHVKSIIGETLRKYSVGDNVLPKYRVRLHYAYQDPRNKLVTFETDAAAEAFVHGLMIQKCDADIVTEVYGTKGYVVYTVNNTIDCIYCKKKIYLAGDVVNGNAHVECHIKHVARSKVKKHTLKVIMPKAVEAMTNRYNNEYVNDHLLELLSKLFYGNYEIHSATLTDGYNYKYNRQEIALQITSSWYQDQDIKAICLA